MVEAAQADPACFLDLYDRYFDRVYAYIIGRIGNRADAEDVTSEVFMRADRHPLLRMARSAVPGVAPSRRRKPAGGSLEIVSRARRIPACP